jgi:F-type H+-transporting ATPase subunit gamma
MATRKEVRNRIASVKNITKITRAMEMVAAARLRRAEQRIAHLRPYAQAIRKLTRRAAEEAGELPRVPVLLERDEIRRVGIVLITGDRGLAGAFNTNIIREGMRLKGELESGGAHVVFSAVGRRGESALTFRKQELAHAYTGFTDRPAFADAREIAEQLTSAYVDKELDRVDIVFNRYISPLTQYVWRQTLLPLQHAEVFGEGAEKEEPDEEETELEKAHKRALWVYEPEPEELLNRLIPDYVNLSVYRALLESSASELGARMTAMRSAAENAQSMISDLTLEMNRVRQAEITQEILEVVAGAEALG